MGKLHAVPLGLGRPFYADAYSGDGSSADWRFADRLPGFDFRFWVICPCEAGRIYDSHLDHRLFRADGVTVDSDRWSPLPPVPRIGISSCRLHCQHPSKTDSRLESLLRCIEFDDYAEIIRLNLNV